MCACVCKLHGPMGTWIPSHMDLWARALTWVRALTWTRGHGPMGTWIPSLSLANASSSIVPALLSVSMYTSARSLSLSHTVVELDEEFNIPGED